MSNKETIFEQIISEYQHKIYRLCWSYVQNEDDRNDLFQTILLKIWNNLDSFKDNSSLGTWIFRLSVNTSIDYIRKNKNLAHMSTHVDISNLSIIDTSNDVEKNLLLSENLKLLYRCINQLSVIDRTLIYFYLEDLKYREIADILGISEKNVSVKLHRIKKILKQHFKDLEE